ncbi:membrane-spanning 4-domains subfamily A member 12-like isoform X2 [Mustela erminea]|uniref:membrane-spanning 4-domains subfamily A member 12-like isoform X2 n=1 Tax=Mustela erminea TaxID=36723 RepID=UPI0013874688|nr:membrane-spanning 4-domains subfamily A member 12-like isoform X2 [Mustela erminea]
MRASTEEVAPVHMSELRNPESRTRRIQMSELQEPEPRSPHGIIRTKKHTRHKTSSHIVLKEETRMMGAAQVMIGLIHCVLGYFWIYLYVREFESVSINYLPLTLMSGYPFWAFLFFIISGIFSIEAEKTRSPKLLRCSIRTNTYSSTLAMIGLFLIGFEITFFLIKREKIIWIQQSGMMLSGYLWLFSLLELFLANIVNSWINQAFYHGSNLI